MKLKKEIVNPLLGWYEKNARVLPWREISSPYHVWVSEIMLQQTRVEAVIDYYNRFIERLPTIDALAQIDEEQLLKLWEGLGYYSRVRNLQKSAKIICEQYHGVMPKNYDELIQLPGIGAYTAGAISSIAYQNKSAAVDGNVLRVLTRVTESKLCIDEEKTKKEFKHAIEEIMPKQSGMFNQALMELGATICIPNGKPLCDICPIQKLCQANKSHKQTEYPVRKEKKKREIVPMTVLLLMTDQVVAIEKRSDKGLLANFYEFPNVEGHIDEQGLKEYLRIKNISFVSVQSTISSKHIFTHKEWHMNAYIVWIEKSHGEFIYATMEELQEVYPLPNAFQKYKDLVAQLWHQETYLNFKNESKKEG